MFGFLRRLLGMDREDRLVASVEKRDRDDALRSADRARKLAKQLREDEVRRRELAVRLEVIRRR